MKYLTLVAIEDPTLGETGLVIKTMNLNNIPEGEIVIANDGSLIAHDILEHQNGIHNIGSIADELEALGGLWYVRGQYGVLNPKNRSIYTPHQSVASDIARMAILYCINKIPLGKPVPRTYKHICDRDFEEILQYGKEDSINELLSQYGEGECCPYLYEAYFRNALHFLRVGYNKAKRRFPNQYQVNDLFFNMTTIINHNIDLTSLYVGQEYLLGYDMHRVTVKEIVNEHYY